MKALFTLVFEKLQQNLQKWRSAKYVTENAVNVFQPQINSNSIAYGKLYKANEQIF